MTKLPIKHTQLVYALTAAILLFLSWNSMAARSPEPPKDFYNTWSFTRALLSDCNPYTISCRAKIMETETAEAGVQLEVVEPPNLFSFFCWSTNLGLKPSLIIWRIVTSLLLIASIFMIGKMLSSSPFPSTRSELLWILLVFLNFPPASIDISLGQISAIVVFGLALFALSIKHFKFNSFCAGLALSLTLIKPNLLYLLYLYVALEALRTRSYRLICGGVLGTVISFGIPIIFRPALLHEFSQALSHYSTDMMRATFGTWLRLWFGEGLIKLDYLLAISASIAMLIWWLRKKDSVNDDLRIFLVWLPLFSIISTPYCLPYDMVVLIPAMLAIILGTTNTPLIWRNFIRTSLVLLNQYSAIQFSEMQQYAAYAWVILGLCLIKNARAAGSAKH